jgi:hypothetical protein
MELDLKFLPAPVIFSCFLVVAVTEFIKTLDKKDRLKGYRVYAPFLLSAIAAALLALGDFFPRKQAPFWAASVFGLSAFFFEAILKKLKKIHGEG